MSRGPVKWHAPESTAGRSAPRGLCRPAPAGQERTFLRMRRERRAEVRYHAQRARRSPWRHIQLRRLSRPSDGHGQSMGLLLAAPPLSSTQPAADYSCVTPLADSPPPIRPRLLLQASGPKESIGLPHGAPFGDPVPAHRRAW